MALLKGIHSPQWKRLVCIIQEIRPDIDTIHGAAKLMRVSTGSVAEWKKSSQVDFKTVHRVKETLNLTNEAVGFWLAGGDCPLRLQEDD